MIRAIFDFLSFIGQVIYGEFNENHVKCSLTQKIFINPENTKFRIYTSLVGIESFHVVILIMILNPVEWFNPPAINCSNAAIKISFFYRWPELTLRKKSGNPSLISSSKVSLIVSCPWATTVCTKMEITRICNFISVFLHETFGDKKIERNF